MLKRILILGVVVTVFWVRPVDASVPSQTEALFNEAGEAYRSAQYQQAISLYEEIRRGGWESGPLYYNLGSSYFRLGDIGRTILNYERARLLIPRDREPAANYRYALSLRPAGTVDQPRHWLMRLAQLGTVLFNINELTWIVFGIVVMLGLAHGLFLFGLLPRRLFKPVFLLCLVVLLLSLLSLGGTAVFIRDRAIVLEETEARFEPRAQATVHFGLVPGQAVRLMGAEGAWRKIKRFDGKRGWVPKKTVESVIAEGSDS